MRNQVFPKPAFTLNSPSYSWLQTQFDIFISVPVTHRVFLACLSDMWDSFLHFAMYMYLDAGLYSVRQRCFKSVSQVLLALRPSASEIWPPAAVSSQKITSARSGVTQAHDTSLRASSNDQHSVDFRKPAKTWLWCQQTQSGLVPFRVNWSLVCKTRTNSHGFICLQLIKRHRGGLQSTGHKSAQCSGIANLSYKILIFIQKKNMSFLYLSKNDAEISLNWKCLSLSNGHWQDLIKRSPLPATLTTLKYLKSKRERIRLAAHRDKHVCSLLFIQRW